MPYPSSRQEPQDFLVHRSLYGMGDDFKKPTFPDWGVTISEGSTGSVTSLQQTGITDEGYEVGGGIVKLTTGTDADDFTYMFHNEPIFRWNTYAPILVEFSIKYSEAITDDLNIIIGLTERDDGWSGAGSEEPLKTAGGGPNFDGPDTDHHFLVVEKRSGERWWRSFNQNGTSTDAGENKLAESTVGVPEYNASLSESTITLGSALSSDQFRDYGEEVTFQTSSNRYAVKRRLYDADTEMPTRTKVVIVGDASAEASADSIDLYNLAPSPEWQLVELSYGRGPAGGRENASASFITELFQSSATKRRKRSIHSEAWTGGNANASTRVNMRAMIGIKKKTAGAAESMLIDYLTITQGRARHV